MHTICNSWKEWVGIYSDMETDHVMLQKKKQNAEWHIAHGPIFKAECMCENNM